MNDDENVKKKVKLNQIILIALLIILIIVAIVLLICNTINNTEEENNLSNLGLACEDEEYIFYYKYQEGIIKIKDGTEYQISDEQAYSLNYYDGYVYYTTPNSNGGIDIKKLTSNGDTTETLKSTSSSSTKMYLYDGYLYFLTTEPNTISKIDINGENETTLITRKVSNFEVTDDKIYFTDDTSALYSIDLNGENYNTISEDEIGEDFQVYENLVYYYDDSQGLMCLDMEKLTTELVSDLVNSSTYNVTDEAIYYLDTENLKICKIDLDGDDYTELVDVNTTNAKINIVDDEIYYISVDEDSGNYITCRIKTNGKATDAIEY